MQQLSIFEESTRAESIIQDIRTEKQANKNISYDVGVKIGSAIKDIFSHRKAFLDIPNVESLKAIEDEDIEMAAELVNRDTFFNWFSLENCKEHGLEPVVAKAIQLLIHRIPKAPADSKEDRETYTRACLYISDKLRNITTLDEFKAFETVISRYLSYEGYSKDYCLRVIRSTEESLQYEKEESAIKDLKLIIEDRQKIIRVIDEADEIGLSILGKSFRNFFRNRNSRKSAYETIRSVESWEDLLKTNSSAPKGEKKNKPVWERQVPERPDRMGGPIIEMEKPEEFALMFGFKGVEFGHYVQDDIGRTHLFRAAEALTDLADILDVPVTSLSLNGELSFGFGSRGRGKAWGHFEPAKRVINLTKKKGSLGILAHEWCHSLDNHLNRISHNFSNGKIGFVTEGNCGPHLSNEIQLAIQQFVDSLTQGTSKAFINVAGRKLSYRVYSSFIRRYEAVEGDLQAFMDDAMAEFDASVERNLSMYLRTSPKYYDSAKEKYERKRKRELRTNAEALAQYHEEQTGEVVKLIPYTTNRTQFFQTAIDLDKGKIKYWATNVELAARAFEAYIYDELKVRGWTSDYLVCGVRDELFPQGEERVRINQTVKGLIDCIRPLL